MKRSTSELEVKDIISYWLGRGRTSHFNEDSLIMFLHTFTPKQIKGAMYIATSTGREAYFRYLCGILQNWKRTLEEGGIPKFFDVEE